ncbi:hypothetical protein ACFX19_033796 [Malus domestica]
MTDQSGNSSSLLGQVVLESPYSSGKSKGKGTNEELQATMIQRRLDLEFSTPKGAQGSGMSQVTIRSEPVIPLFPLLEEETDRGKKKAVPEGSQLVIEPVLEKEFPSFPLLSFNNRKQSE